MTRDEVVDNMLVGHYEMATRENIQYLIESNFIDQIQDFEQGKEKNREKPSQ